MQRLHYFDLDRADPADFKLGMAKMQGYVPELCLLAGIVVIDEISKGHDPCTGCRCDRAKCKGRPEGETP